MNELSHRAFAVITIPLAAIAVIGLTWPARLGRYLGGPRNYRAPKLELFVRFACSLVLIGAAIELAEWLWTI
jgi:hypothetical protein